PWIYEVRHRSSYNIRRAIGAEGIWLETKPSRPIDRKLKSLEICAPHKLAGGNIVAAKLPKVSHGQSCKCQSVHVAQAAAAAGNAPNELVGCVVKDYRPRIDSDNAAPGTTPLRFAAVIAYGVAVN